MTSDFPIVAWSAVLAETALGAAGVSIVLDVTGDGEAGRSGSAGRPGVVGVWFVGFHMAQNSFRRID